MKAKTINIILTRKFEDWLSSIDDENLKTLVRKNTMITGGCITSLLLNEKVNDYDLYFKTKDTAKAVAEYYVKKFLENPPPRFQSSGQKVDIYTNVESGDGGRVKIIIKSAGIASEEENDNYRYFEMTPVNVESLDAGEYVEGIMDILTAEQETDKPPYRPIFMSSNAITLANQVQLIIRFYGEPDKIHENYDFIHCTNYWDSKTRTLHLNQKALECILTKELKYVGSKYPVCSLFRIRKFIDRGWTINAGQILKIAFQVNDLKLTEMDVLEDQLIGVDAAYFLEIVRLLREKDPDKVNKAYLIEILDRMF